MNNIEKLYKKPLPSSRSGAFYNTFSYPTKISPEAIAIYIACATKPGDTVLDAFAGSGSTGIAALLCEHPTQQMLDTAKALGVSPKWGARNAVLYEIGTYASFAISTLLNRLSASEYKDAVSEFIKRASQIVGSAYNIPDPDGKKSILRYAIWSEVLKCPSCSQENTYFDLAMERESAMFKKTVICPHCGKIHDVEDMPFVTEEYYDPILNRSISRKKRIPAWVYGTTDGQNWDRPARLEAECLEPCKELHQYHADAKEIARNAQSMIDRGEVEDRLRHFLSASLLAIFPDSPWWVRAHALGSEEYVRFATDLGTERGGFVDTVIGKTAVEYEKDLNRQAIFDEGYHQVKEYCAALANVGIAEDEILGVLSDTVRWHGYTVRIIDNSGALYGPDDVELLEVARVDLSVGNEEEYQRFEVFCERFFNRDQSRLLNATTLSMDFGVDSQFYQEHIASIEESISRAMAAKPDYAALIKQVWQNFVAYLDERLYISQICNSHFASAFPSLCSL